ncbi:hypothetical protein MPTK1_6g15400 [Marchantia polymorpha subsp. ruderalis]|uniref:THH1/TOM1/TOM3 domain-containing protein n=2 Tax=Marchantia polymorpha TaxID=3197 RepID=A0AAF6BSB3_MARPO|nr:hypothetical protein MARPO_0056s0052 [Marchantia polymorpha]BBN14897.1 hypothetical protein Mp_6g15400 [Marchantia polymorpha subsp. ruderalis]|eukprot:PTQ37582.1 hypothetical protein MARPO_0056s0052 [Marchantia polymorpha]
MFHEFLDVVKHVVPPNVVAPWASMDVSQCLSTAETVVYASLAGIDGVIAVAAFVQLFRLYTHSRQNVWTRQKVFHCLIGASNLGYTVYFVLNPQAACGDWPCWPHACGFVLIAVPQIVFLATFLLLLSFWVDVCHQATDQEEEEEDDDDEDENQTYTAVPPSSPVVRLQHVEKHRRCCICIKKLRVRGRQKFVIAAVALMCALTAAFAILIWYGMGDNVVDSATLAEVYSYFYAVVILLSGGGLAVYGLTLYHKMCKLRSGKQSADITKVAGLAVVSVVCFTLRALLVFVSDIPVINIWHVRQENKKLAALSTFLYYFVGESIPAIVVLWVMRDMPPGSRSGTHHTRIDTVVNETTLENGLGQTLIPQDTLMQGLLGRWMIPTNDAEPGGVYAYKSKASSPSLEVDRVSPD